jgi:hypothetical protein
MKKKVDEQKKEAEKMKEKERKGRSGKRTVKVQEKD